MDEIAQMMVLIRRCNFATYQTPRSDPDMPRERRARELLDFAAAFGLDHCEHHRSADDDGVVALEVAQDPARTGYIPYTDRPLKWHTDGYYNAIGTPVRAFLLHCARDAAIGGESAVLDPEIAYIRLRDANPRHIAALMHHEAMTIPANVEPDGSVRPARTGPVFSVDPSDTTLHMRYTARGRNIVWRDDSDTRAAVDFLNRMLDGDEPLIHRLKLAPGQGILCNNVLHKRSGFSQGASAHHRRLLNRIRFHDRISRPDEAAKQSAHEKEDLAPWQN